MPSKSIPIQVPELDYWPTTGWQSSTPASQGMDSDLLAQMLEDVATNETRIHSLLVIRNGCMVTEAYFHPYLFTPTPKLGELGESEPQFKVIGDKLDSLTNGDPVFELGERPEFSSQVDAVVEMFGPTDLTLPMRWHQRWLLRRAVIQSRFTLPCAEEIAKVRLERMETNL